MNKTILPIKGMHCRSCEILIAEKLSENPDIKNVHVSWKYKTAEIYSKHPLDMQKTEQMIREAGYDVGKEESKSWITHDPSQWRDLIIFLGILLGLYFWGNILGLGKIFNISSAIGGSNLAVVLLVGLTAGISTCMAMVGGLILSISARHSEKHPEATSAQKFRPHIFFNTGRILSYFLLGGFIGLIGKTFQLSGITLGIMTLIVGIVMFLLGLQLTEMFPRLSNGGLTLPAGISKFLGIRERDNREYSHINSMIVGALTFFLPCGFTQAMQLYAISTGNFWSGAMIMGVFALGTAPGLLGIGGLTSIIKGAFAKKFFKFVGLAVVFLAIFNISNGYNLTGWRIFGSAKNPTLTTDPNVQIENGVQIVRMKQSASGFSPNKFIIRENIPVKWIVTAQDLNACSSSIMVAKLNIRKNLTLGENVIEFTPKETGEIKFTCSMGMYPGKFTVVKNSSLNSSSSSAGTSVSSDSLSDAPVPPNSSSSSSQSSNIVSDTPPATPKKDTLQIIRATYKSWQEDITPNQFNVEAGVPVKFVIDVQADGQGCMSSIMIPGLVNEPDFFEKGRDITFDFTPQKGTYEITCAMGVPRGKIIAT